MLILENRVLQGNMGREAPRYPPSSGWSNFIGSYRGLNQTFRIRSMTVLLLDEQKTRRLTFINEDDMVADSIFLRFFQTIIRV